MSHEKAQHPYHIVDLSPWPILTAFSLLIASIGGVMYMHKYVAGHYVLSIGILFLASCMFFWWRDVLKEGKANHHTIVVQRGLRIGMALFILSEVMFFVAFFWSFFKARLFPEGMLDEAGIWIIGDGVWPPKNIKLFDPWDIPFMNTLVLLLSGTSVTWAHYSIMNNDRKNTVKALGCTILLALFFTSMQAYEYHHATFKFTDGIYATNFYMATGFHGAHVIIGTIFLFTCYLRARNGDFEKGKSHLGFEFAAWYWHFVDVIWLFLFVFLYVLG